MSERLDREYFEELYAASPDPWNFETSDYEREKYARTLGVLGGRRFRRALEAGASIGVFTRDARAASATSCSPSTYRRRRWPRPARGWPG